jgi:hypothetical protein
MRPQNLVADCLEWTTAPPIAPASVDSRVCSTIVQDLIRIGSLLGLPIIVPTDSRLTDPLRLDFSLMAHGTANAATSKFWRVPLIWEPCDVVLYPPAWGGNDDCLLAYVLAHEVVHCYQNEVWIEMGEVAIHRHEPAFVVEGSAAYLAAADLGYLPPGQSPWWGPTPLFAGGTTWSGDPGTSLTDRSYDAMGLALPGRARPAHLPVGEDGGGLAARGNR